MADSLCTQTILLDDAVCYSGACLGQQEQMALLVYAKALLLAGMGGTDYTSALTTTLLQDAKTLNLPVDDMTIRAAKIKMAFRDAALSGASVPSTVNAQMAIAKCLVCASPDQLILADLLLSCSIERLGAVV